MFLDGLYFIVTFGKPVTLSKIEGLESKNLILQVEKHACLYNWPMSLQAYRDTGRNQKRLIGVTKNCDRIKS